MNWQRLLFWRRRERDIFTFWDGTRTRSIDPMPAWFAMAEDPECDAPKDMPRASAGDREAWVRVQAMACRMFGVTTFDKGGLTEDEIMRLLGRFFVFNRDLKKKREEFRAQWEHSVGESPDESTTQPAGESSSTPSESSSDEQPACSPECQPPSET